MEYAQGQSVPLGPSGEARLSLRKNDLLVRMVSGPTFSLDRSLVPDSVSKLPDISYRVAVSKDYTRLYTLVPWTGMYRANFQAFKANPNQPPMAMPPFEPQGMTRDGKPYPKDWLEFRALCPIIEGACKGLVISIKFHYNFTGSADGLAALRGQRSRHTQFLARFLDVSVGLDRVQIPFSENLLPPLQTLLQKHGRSFQVILNQGFPETFAEDIAPRRKTQGPKKK